MPDLFTAEAALRIEGAEPATALDMIRDGQCTAMCLVAFDSEAKTCGCPCGGTWHGVLNDAKVPGATRRPRPQDMAPDHGPPTILDQEYQLTAEALPEAVPA